MLPLLALVLTQPAADPFAKWEKEIAALETKWKAAPPKPGGVVFTGSSSIRLWDLKKSFPDNADYINAGFGGSTVPDSTHFVSRLVFPHKPRAVVFYAGDNDLAANRKADRVVEDTAAFFAAVHKELPKATVYYLPVKYSPSRTRLYEQQKDVNARVKKLTEKDPARLKYIDLDAALMKDGQPDKSLFKDDLLHLNPAGYAKWAPVVKDAVK